MLEQQCRDATAPICSSHHYVMDKKTIFGALHWAWPRRDGLIPKIGNRYARDRSRRHVMARAFQKTSKEYRHIRRVKQVVEIARVCGGMLALDVVVQLDEGCEV
jgi:hypothetical protein